MKALQVLRLQAAGLATGMLLAACGGSAAVDPSAASANLQQPPAVEGLVSAPGGPFLVDASGRRLQFHGVNIVAKCESNDVISTAAGAPCLPGPAGSTGTEPQYYLALDDSEADPERRLTEGEVATLAAMGFSSARVGIIWAALEPGPAGVQANDPRYCTAHAYGTPFAPLAAADEPYDQAAIDAYLAHIDGLVAMLARHGIRSLIDMHQDDYSAAFYDPDGSTPWKAEGAPPWAVCTAPASSASPLPASTQGDWGTANFGDLRILSAFDHFWANDVSANLQGEFIRTWVAVASHYRGNPAVLGYDLFNEPSDTSIALPPEFDRKLQCFYAGRSNAPLSCLATLPPQQSPDSGLIPALQAVDPEHPIFFEPSEGANLGLPNSVAVLEPLPFANLVYGFHVYPEPPATALLEQVILDEEQLGRALMQTKQSGGPAWFLTEFGAENNVSDLANYGSLADSKLLSWMYWSAKQFHDPTGQLGEGLLDSDGTPLPIAAVLTRAYALATAGTPTAQSFDPASGAFSYSYTPDPAVTAPTQIFVPVAQYYPKGYQVSVSGASVTSAPNAPLLTLQNTAGAAAVTLKLSAAGG
jgi:endoglycosylceramidase